MNRVIFAHVSDPHFAAERITPHPVQALGQNGHDLRLCQELPSALDHFRQRTGFVNLRAVPLVMSGDLTRTGENPAEFETGLEFFDGAWPNPGNRPWQEYGLKLGTGKWLKIPGNHDHWDGDTTNQWGYNAAIKPRFFATTPWDARIKAGRLVVEFYGVDSGSGYPPIGSGKNRRARGKIHRDELNRLTQKLVASEAAANKTAPGDPPPVRVIVCHHSFQGNWLVSWFFGSLELDGPSQSALRYLAGRYEVAAILTGHSHDFLGDRYHVKGNRKRGLWELREFRSATTLQAEARPFKQGFYGHCITLNDSGEIWWAAYPYEWQGSYFYPLAVDERVPDPGVWNPFYFHIV